MMLWRTRILADTVRNGDVSTRVRTSCSLL